MAFRPWKSIVHAPNAEFSALVAVCPSATPCKGGISLSHRRCSSRGLRERRVFPVVEEAGERAEKQKPYIVTFANAYGESGQLEILKGTLRSLLAKTTLLDVGSGRLSRRSFMACLKEEYFQKMMSEFGVQPHRAGLAFKLMDTQGAGEISIDEFVEGMVRFKMKSESGKELDMKTLSCMLEERHLADMKQDKRFKSPLLSAQQPASGSRFGILKTFRSFGQTSRTHQAMKRHSKVTFKDI